MGETRWTVFQSQEPSFECDAKCKQVVPGRHHWVKRSQWIMKRDENGVFVQAIRKKKERKKENPLRRKPGGHFKALHLLWVFFPPGRWRAEEIITWERGEGRKRAHLCLCQEPHLFSNHNPCIPQGKVWQRKRQREEWKAEEGRDCGGDLHASLNSWLRVELTFY